MTCIEIFILISAILAIFAFLGDFIITSILGHFQENYSHIEDTMSELGNKESRFKNILSIWWFIWGVILMIFSIGLLCAILPYFAYMLPIPIAIFIFGFGAGCVAGLFPEDSKGAEESVSGKIHGIFGGLGFLALLTTPISFIVIGGGGDWFGVISIIVLILGIGFFTLFMLSKNPKIGKSGLWQRLFLFNYYLYMIVIAVVIMIHP